MVRIPRRLDEILPTLTMDKLLDVLQQPDLSGKVREALQTVGLGDAAPLDRVREAWQQARGWIDSVAESIVGQPGNAKVLNATGQLFSSELTAIPWATSVAVDFAKSSTEFLALEALARAAHQEVRNHLGNYSTAWLTSTAEAVRLLISGLPMEAGVAVSRIDAVRLGGLGDIRSMLAAGQAKLTEVGASNEVLPEDWKGVLEAGNRLLVLTSPNNLDRQSANQHRSQAVAAAREAGATVIEILADGVWDAGLTDAYGLPNVKQTLEQGVDVVVLPLHFLSGGPAGALVVGAASWVEPCRQQAEHLGVNVNGASLLAATTAIRTAAKSDTDASTVTAQLLLNSENLRSRARRLAVQLSGLGEIAQAEECEVESPLGPNLWGRYRVQSWGVRLRPRQNLEELQRQIAAGEAKQAVRLNLIQQPESLLLNLRFIPPARDHELVLIIGGPASVPSQAAASGVF